MFHVLNRAIQGVTIFSDPGDYQAFLRLLAETAKRFSVRVLAYAVMPNHWHLVLWPKTIDGLSAFMRWLTGTHARRWRRNRGTTGRGAVYQGRFKAIAVQGDRHFLVLCRYVERNPVRAQLVKRAEEWPWSSASRSAYSAGRPEVATWPVPKPEDWIEYLNEPEVNPWLRETREAVRRNVHFGDITWQENTRRELGWRSGRGAGRPRQFRRD